MPKFKKKPVVIEAITFAEFVQYGKDNGGNIVNGMPWSFEYKGHGITHENDQAYLIPTLEGIMKFTPDDMLITGVNGEIYPCKLDIFENTYESVSDETKGLTFGQALELMKKGYRVAREGWNGKGMWIIFTPGRVVENLEPNSFYERCGFQAPVTIGGHIDMKAADGTMVVGWLASQTDMLAKDWGLLNEPLSE